MKLLVLSLLMLLSGCNSSSELATGRVNAVQTHQMIDLEANATRISSVQIRSQSLLIGGTNLSGIDQISLENDTLQVDLKPISQNDTQLVADSGAPFKSLGLISGSVYSLTLTDSTSQQTTKIEITYFPQE